MQNKTLKGNRIIYNFISGVLEVSVRSQQGSDPTTTGQNRNRDTNDTRCDVRLSIYIYMETIIYITPETSVCTYNSEYR